MDKKEDLEKKFLNIKKEIESYEAKDFLYKLADVQNNALVKNKKIKLFLNWIITMLILIWASPIIISYLTIILIKDIFKYIKSKIGNKL